jgi:hypothetical protein
MALIRRKAKDAKPLTIPAGKSRTVTIRQRELDQFNWMGPQSKPVGMREHLPVGEYALRVALPVLTDAEVKLDYSNPVTIEVTEATPAEATAQPQRKHVGEVLFRQD